jgi:histidinol-phosphatase
VTADPADLRLAIALADRADAITTAAFTRTDLLVETKADRTPVTEADREVELAVRSELAASRPADAVVGEEYGESSPPSSAGETGAVGSATEAGADTSPARRWIIDPIDGTKNFVRRIPVWATLLALEEGGRVTVGVVSAPALGRRWWAARGLGAFAGAPGGEGSRIHVSGVRELADAHVSGSDLGAWEERGGPGPFLALAGRCFWDRNFGDFWSHMLVAEGSCDIGLDPVVALWDVAAVQVLVEEAGGRFTDLQGATRPDGGSAMSSNGLLHDEALAILNQTVGRGTVRGATVELD